MATTLVGLYSVTDSASAPVTQNLTRWPVFAQKEDCIKALCGMPGNPAIEDVIMRLSNTDTSDWTAASKGSVAT
jgi:hypothetical protein